MAALAAWRRVLSPGAVRGTPAAKRLRRAFVIVVAVGFDGVRRHLAGLVAIDLGLVVAAKGLVDLRTFQVGLRAVGPVLDGGGEVVHGPGEILAGGIAAATLHAGQQRLRLSPNGARQRFDGILIVLQPGLTD